MNTTEYKWALVTGGNKGIGLSIINRLFKDKHNVTSISRSADVDLTDRNETLEGAEEFDILINCAGAQAHSSFIDYPLEQWDYDLELNLTAHFRLSQVAARGMKERGWGRIVNISSIAGLNGTRNIIGYSVAKAGLIEMTKCMSNELAPYGITVNAVAPGFIETDMLKGLTENTEHADQMLKRIPVGKFGKPDDIANLVSFLCSDEASYITGQTFVVDGGFLVR